MRNRILIYIISTGIVVNILTCSQTVCPADPQMLRIAACQFPISGVIAENAEWIQKQMREAKEKRAQVVQFPECALSGYWGADFPPSDNPDWNDLRKQTEKIMALADQLDLWVVLGSTHPLGDGIKPHNSLYVIDPAGRIVDRYDKRFCTTGDLRFYSPGDHFVTFAVNGVTCGLLICYDVRFPELFREYFKLGVDLIFHSFHNARKDRNNILPIIMPITSQARAATNYFYMSLSNSCVSVSWPCHFITPDGLVAQKLDAGIPGVLISDIDLNRKFKDASRPFREEAIDGILNSGKTVRHIRSQDRTCY